MKAVPPSPRRRASSGVRSWKMRREYLSSMMGGTPGSGGGSCFANNTHSNCERKSQSV